MTSSRPAINTLLITVPNFPPSLHNLFKTVLHHPEGRRAPVAESDIASADAIYGHVPINLKHRAQAPKLRFVQLPSAGANADLSRPLWEETEKEGEERVRIMTAAGVHVACMPQWFIATTLSLFHKLHEQCIIGHTERRWAKDIEFGGHMFIRELRTQTVGVLGYGHIGRECARLAKAFGANVIAANSSGKRKPEDGFAEEGTGDPDGSIPSAWYQSTEPSSLADFLRATDVLLLSLPSTAATRHLMNASTLAHLRPTSILINLGRGDAVDQDALLAALDGGKLAGAALDVTEPEPLPDGHPLFGRKDVIVTPHLGGRTERYWERAAGVLEENVRRWRAGEGLVNEVDPKRGY